MGAANGLMYICGMESLFVFCMSCCMLVINPICTFEHRFPCGILVEGRKLHMAFFLGALMTQLSILLVSPLLGET